MSGPAALALVDAGALPGDPTVETVTCAWWSAQTPLPAAMGRVRLLAADAELPTALQEAGESLVVLDVFASWCVPCLAEHPLITELAEAGTRVYGINHRDTADDAITWLRRHGNPYAAIGFDADARASLEWGVTGVPETFIIDRDGTIAYKHTGPLTRDVLERRIVPKLREVAGG